MKKISTLLMALVLVLSATANNLATQEDTELTFGNNTPVAFEYNESNGTWHCVCVDNSNAYGIDLYYSAAKEGKFGTYNANVIDMSNSFINDFGGDVTVHFISDDLTFTFTLNADSTRYTFSAYIISEDGNTYICQGEWDYEPEVTALDNVENNAAVTKTIKNGQVVIIRDGVKYTTAGVVTM